MSAKPKILSVIVCKNTPHGTLVLMLQRNASLQHAWQPVTGHVDPGEDFIEAADREMREETSLIPEGRPHYLGIEHKFKGRWGDAVERAYVIYVTTPSVPTLTEEHEAFEWLTPEKAIERVEFPHQKEAIFRASHPAPPLVLSKEGIWYQSGEEITHARTVDLLHQSLVRTPEGKYIVRIGLEEADAVLEDAALYIRAVNLDSGMLTLQTGRQAALDASTCYATKENYFYCRVDGEKAKFLRAAYYTLAQKIREETDSLGKTQYFLHFLGRDYLIPITDE